jgi:hypothetical protein
MSQDAKETSLSEFLAQIPEDASQTTGKRAPSSILSVSFCRQDTITRGGGFVTACFAPTFDGACRESNRSDISTAAILDQGSVGRCGQTGSSVWRFLHN